MAAVDDSLAPGVVHTPVCCHRDRIATNSILWVDLWSEGSLVSFLV